MIRAEQTDFAAASGSACSTSLGVGGCRQSAAPLLLTEAFQGIPDIWQVSQHSLGVCVFGWATEAKEAASLHCYQWIRFALPAEVLYPSKTRPTYWNHHLTTPMGLTGSTPPNTSGSPLAPAAMSPTCRLPLKTQSAAPSGPSTRG